MKLAELKKEFKKELTESFGAKIHTLTILENDVFYKIFLTYGKYVVEQVHLSIHKRDMTTFSIDGKINMYHIEDVNEFFKTLKEGGKFNE